MNYFLRHAVVDGVPIKVQPIEEWEAAGWCPVDVVVDESMELPVEQQGFVLGYNHELNKSGYGTEDLFLSPRLAGAVWHTMSSILRPGDGVAIQGCERPWARAIRAAAAMRHARPLFIEPFCLKMPDEDMPWLISTLPILGNALDESIVSKLILHDSMDPEYDQWLAGNSTKYDQARARKLSLEAFGAYERRNSETFDTFFVGQIYRDSAYLLVEKPWGSVVDACITEAIANPNKRYVYKPHVFCQEFAREHEEANLQLIADLGNVSILFDDIHDIAVLSREICVVSSSVGLERGLRGDMVRWLSNHPYSRIDTNSHEARWRAFSFFRAMTATNVEQKRDLIKRMLR